MCAVGRRLFQMFSSDLGRVAWMTWTVAQSSFPGCGENQIVETSFDVVLYSRTLYVILTNGLDYDILRWIAQMLLRLC